MSESIMAVLLWFSGQSPDQTVAASQTDQQQPLGTIYQPQSGGIPTTPPGSKN